jgi:hypothetical protein
MRTWIVVLLASCGDNGGVNSTDAAKAAYLGLDKSIDKAITEGFAGFNTASSANIPTETASGDISGTMAITGQVDQGQSANKGMRLNETLSAYADTDAGITYDTDPDAGAAALGMQLKGIPTGSLTGTLSGVYDMTGALKGPVTLALSFTGTLEATDAGGVDRKPGTTHITGTATSPSGTYAVDVTR